MDRAFVAAIASAAVGGDVVEPDEQALGHRRLCGETSQPELLRPARELATAKANARPDMPSDGKATMPDGITGSRITDPVNDRPPRRDVLQKVLRLMVWLTRSPSVPMRMRLEPWQC